MTKPGVKRDRADNAASELSGDLASVCPDENLFRNHASTKTTARESRPVRQFVKINLSRIMILMLFAAVLSCLGSGCASGRQARFSETLMQWVPNGTAVDDAARTMKLHGFNCQMERNASSDNSRKPGLVCRKHNSFLNRSWFVVFHVRDGRVSDREYYVSNDFFRVAPANP